MKTNKEKNRMILEFMGVKPGFNSFTNKWGWGDSPWFACSYDTEEEVMDAVAKYAKYDSDWNWLMRAVLQIESLSYTKGRHFYLEMTQAYVGFKVDRMNAQPFSMWGANNRKFGAIYDAVVEFIEWYNEKK